MTVRFSSPATAEALGGPAGSRVPITLATLDTPVTGIANSETIAFQYAAPAGFFRVTDRLSIKFTSTKSGTTDNGIWRIRVGTAGTTADAQIHGFQHMAATTRQSSGFAEMRFDSATTLLAIGNTQAPYGYPGAASTVAFPAAVTIPNISNALFISLTMNSSSTNDTLAVPDAQLELIMSPNRP